MPVVLHAPIRRISQDEFGELAFELMRHIFAIHDEIGRFFDEKIYKRELANRMQGVQVEVPINITFRSLQKRYFIDVLVNDGGIFELKAVESLVGRHRSQLLNYLLLCDVSHGKLINIRRASVEHEFVNTHWQHVVRTQFEADTKRWNASIPGTDQLHEFLTALLRDLGSGLSLELYEEAIEHCFGGVANMETNINVEIAGRRVGQQLFRLIAPGVAFKTTGFDGPLEPFEIQARKLLAHIDLRAFAWVNITMKKVTFTTLQR